MQSQAEVITEEDLQLIQERESAIRQLEVRLSINQEQLCVFRKKTPSQLICLCRRLIQSDIVDINDIFKDLGMMIHEQGDMIGEVSPATVAPELFTGPPVFDKRGKGPFEGLYDKDLRTVVPCCFTKCHFWGQCASSSR